MSDDTLEPGLDSTGETTPSSPNANGPLASDLAETLRLIEQKRAAGRAEQEQRGSTWREPPRRAHEPDAPRPPAPGRPRPEPPRVACEACHDQGYLGYSWHGRPCTCATGERWQREQDAKQEALRQEEAVYRQQWEHEQRLALLEQLDKAYRGWDKDTYPRQGNQKALRKVLEFVEAGTYQQRGLGLVGPVGCGKTSLLVTAYKLVAPRLLEYPSVSATTIRFVSVLDMFDLWRNSFDEDRRTGEPRFAQLFKRCAEARLLILDDLGAERPTEWTQEQLNKLIDYRARKELPTWFTTNCSLEELEQLLTPRCYSRLVYQADVLEVTGPDLRKLCR
jgi:DNA replication protein DnaC